MTTPGSYYTAFTIIINYLNYFQIRQYMYHASITDKNLKKRVKIETYNLVGIVQGMIIVYFKYVTSAIESCNPDIFVMNKKHKVR